MLRIIDAEVMIGYEGFTQWSGTAQAKAQSPLSGEEVHDWVELSVKKKEKVYEGSREQKARGETRKKKKTGRHEKQA